MKNLREWKTMKKKQEDRMNRYRKTRHTQKIGRISAVADGNKRSEKRITDEIS